MRSYGIHIVNSTAFQYGQVVAKHTAVAKVLGHTEALAGEIPMWLKVTAAEGPSTQI